MFFRRGASQVAGGRARSVLIVALAGLLLFSAYGTLFPSDVRCQLPGAVGCAGGLLGPALTPATGSEQWFAVVMYDWGFWITDTTTGANETTAWNVFEGWTIHINATSLPPDAAIGGTAYHGLGVELNATGQQLLSLAAPVGTVTQGSFVAPNAAYHHQHIWCTISCGPGHGGQQAWVLNVIPALPLPAATAHANATFGPAPLSVALVGTASLGTAPYNVSWNFGDGSPPVFAYSANHTYTLGGDYAASFLVTDSKGMTASAAVNIVVNSSAPIFARASASPSSGVAPFSTALRVEAHGGLPPYTFTWSFGDGSSLSNGTNSTHHLYLAAGVYTVVATVRDYAGATTRALASISSLPPQGYFPVSVRATPSNGTAPLAVQLNATPGGGTAPYTYLWNLGDGATGVGAGVNHQYNQSGSYVAVVFVVDSARHAGFGTVVLPLKMGQGGGDDVPFGTGSAPARGQTLALRPVLSPNDGGSPLVVNASVSIEGGNATNENVSWNFGDGTTGSGQVVSHRYSAMGPFTVSVSATDSGGNHGTNSTSVRVEPLSMTIVVNRTAGDDPFILGASVTLVGGSGLYNPTRWTWGDGNGSTGNLSNHSYAASLTGIFVIRASTTDSLGAGINASLSIQVNPKLLASLIVALPASKSTPMDVHFTLSVSGGSGTYSSTPFWNFGDGSGSHNGSPTSHQYTKAGSYRVTVMTNDSLGTSVMAAAWANLTVAAPGGVHSGPPPWSLTGVSDPNNVALILMGLVAGSGLVLLVRRRRAKKPPTSTKSPVGAKPTRVTHQGSVPPGESAP